MFAIGFWALGPVGRFLASVGPEAYDSILLFDSLVLVAALFGAFSFSYEFSNVENIFERYLGHVTTGLFMMSIFLLLEVAVITMSLLVGARALVFEAVAVMIYAGTVGYDFWDLFRRV